MKFEIKHRFTSAVIFSCEANNLKEAVEQALQSGADLSGADLSGADLSRANLSGANLSGADLSGAYLSGADLSRAYMSGANLSGAYMSGANLSGANLSGAYLSGAYMSGAYLSGAYMSGAYLKNGEKLVGKRPAICIGPVGSRSAYFTAFLTDKGLRFDVGCQTCITKDFFIDRIKAEHGESIHAKEYLAALAFVDVHAELWTLEITEN